MKNYIWFKMDKNGFANNNGEVKKRTTVSGLVRKWYLNKMKVKKQKLFVKL